MSRCWRHEETGNVELGGNLRQARWSQPGDVHTSQQRDAHYLPASQMGVTLLNQLYSVSRTGAIDRGWGLYVNQALSTRGERKAECGSRSDPRYPSDGV
ncbi:hypothetical protein GN956_G18265 [Arapaima gigas]